MRYRLKEETEGRVRAIFAMNTSIGLFLCLGLETIVY